LRAIGVFDQWVEACPLVYRSGNAPAKRDVLGTLMLSILAGHRRYAHITAVRGDAVAAQALGIAGMVSEDAVRRALKTIEAPASEAWMRLCLMRSVASALDRPWVLDIDASVKPLYGHQQGAEIGYSPHKPGRPSHVLHTYWVGNLRLVLDVQLTPGKQHTRVHAKAALERLLEELGDKGPALVRGDCGYGNEGILGVPPQSSFRLPAGATDFPRTGRSTCGPPGHASRRRCQAVAPAVVALLVGATSAPSTASAPVPERARRFLQARRRPPPRGRCRRA
jgi:hypothetical protein